MSLSILVVTYNCSLEESETVNALANSGLRFDGVRLCLWNNGPREIMPCRDRLAALTEQGFAVSFQQTPGNAPLSRIYNYFIKNFPSTRYAILDHDSNLSKEYLQYLLENEGTFLGMPIIQVDGVPQYPRVRRRFAAGPYARQDKVLSIGSGLLISQEAVDCIQAEYGSVFDEHFALYGVDTTFFRRLNALGLAERLCAIPGFEHSLSRLEAESAEMKHFRKVERSYNFGLMLRHYPSAKQRRTFIKEVVQSLFGRNHFLIGKTLKAFFQGRHERCRQAPLEKTLDGR